MCVCVCVCERERERERDGQRKSRSSEKNQHNEPDSPISHRHSLVQCGNGRPFSRAFLSGGVSDLLHQRLLVGVLEGHDIGCDLNEEGVQFTLVPLCEDLEGGVGWSEKEGGGRGGVSGREGRGWEGGRE